MTGKEEYLIIFYSSAILSAPAALCDETSMKLSAFALTTVMSYTTSCPVHQGAKVIPLLLVVVVIVIVVVIDVAVVTDVIISIKISSVKSHLTSDFFSHLFTTRDGMACGNSTN